MFSRLGRTYCLGQVTSIISCASTGACGWSLPSESTSTGAGKAARLLDEVLGLLPCAPSGGCFFLRHKPHQNIRLQPVRLKSVKSALCKGLKRRAVEDSGERVPCTKHELPDAAPSFIRA